MALQNANGNIEQTKQVEPKDNINPAIIKNMIEILNYQILLKVVQFAGKPGAPKTSAMGMFAAKKQQSVSPIDLEIFRQIIPENYKNSMKSSNGD